MRERLLPGAAAFVLTIAALLPAALTLPQHGDETQYGWSAAYFGARLARLDFSLGAGTLLDPGWNYSYWTLTQPMGARFVYAAALAIAGADVPNLPADSVDSYNWERQMRLSSYAILSMRLAAILCAALGFAVICSRFRWRGVLACALFLAIPFVHTDLARGWAEGPLLLGIGLCIAAYGTRWFAPLCGLTVTFKLTALPLFLAAFWHGYGRTRLAHLAGFLVSLGVWVLLTPPSWFGGGPLFLGMMVANRITEYSVQALRPENADDIFLPTRYLLPFVLLALLLAVHTPQLWRRFRRPQSSPAGENPGSVS